MDGISTSLPSAWRPGGVHVPSSPRRSCHPLTFTFSLEAGEVSDHEPLCPERLAGHWIELLERQLAGWARRDVVVEAVLGAANRQNAIERLTGQLGFSAAEAASVLDLPLWRLTDDAERGLREDLKTARKHLGD